MTLPPRCRSLRAFRPRPSGVRQSPLPAYPVGARTWGDTRQKSRSEKGISPGGPCDAPPEWTKQYGDMTHAEQYSTSSQVRPRPPETTSQTGCLRWSHWPLHWVSPPRWSPSPTPASADQISDAKAQAAAITAKLQATQAQIAVADRTGQRRRLPALAAAESRSPPARPDGQGPGRGDQGPGPAPDPGHQSTTPTAAPRNQVTQMFSSNPEHAAASARSTPPSPPAT